MTYDEIHAAIGASPILQALLPGTQALAAHPTFTNRAARSECRLTGRGLVADLTVASGSVALSGAVADEIRRGGVGPGTGRREARERPRNHHQRVDLRARGDRVGDRQADQEGVAWLIQCR